MKTIDNFYFFIHHNENIYAERFIYLLSIPNNYEKIVLSMDDFII